MPTKTYMLVEAVAVLPIDEAVPDEWLATLFEAEHERHLAILEDADDRQATLAFLRDVSYNNAKKKLDEYPFRIKYIKIQNQ